MITATSSNTVTAVSTNAGFPLAVVLALTAMGLGFLLPGHYPPWVSFEQQVLPAVGAVLLMTWLLAQRGLRLGVAPIAAAAMALALVPLLQWAFGKVIHVSDALLSAAYLLAFGVCIVGAQTIGRSRHGAQLRDGLWLTLVLAATASALIALIQWQQLRWSIFIVDLRPGDRPYGNLAQPNHLATLLCLGVLGVLRQWERRKLGSFATALTIALLGWGIVMTQSRTAWLFVALLVLWWAWKRHAIDLRLSGLAMAMAVGLFGLGVLSWTPLNDLLLLSAPSSIESRLQAGTRLVHWPTLWDAAWREPWMGHGWGQVSIAQQIATLDHPPAGEWLSQSHNLVLDLMVHNGALPGLLLSGLLVLWFARHIRACTSIEQWALIAGVGTLVTHALLEYPLDYLYFLLPLGLMIGLLEALHPAPAILFALPRAAFGALVATLGALLLWVVVEYAQVESAVRQLRFVMMGVGVDKVATAPVPDVVLLDQPREFHRYWMTPARPNMSAKDLDWMRDVSTREPRPPAQLRYALAAALNGRAAEAELTLRRMCHLHAGVRCDEGRTSWIAAQQQWPQLATIRFPATPPELAQQRPVEQGAVVPRGAP